MKFALLEGQKIEATKGAKGLCPNCKSELTAKCGEIKVHHWAHKGKRHCDYWWENETDWHRSWKNDFPIEWQEIVHTDEKTGEKHIADVKTDTDWIIEFQHSYLKPEERSSRNTFYRKLVWVVDGTRCKTDRQQFEKILKEESEEIYKKPLIIRVFFPDECRLIKEWSNSTALVFFDFAEDRDNKQSSLWLLYPKMQSGNIYLSYFSRLSFIELSNNDGFDKFVLDVISPIHKEILPMYERNILNQR